MFELNIPHLNWDSHWLVFDLFDKNPTKSSNLVLNKLRVGVPGRKNTNNEFETIVFLFVGGKMW